MAIDEKLVGEVRPSESAIDRLRKRNRIRPWESSLVGSPGSKSDSGGVVSSTSRQETQGADDPLGISLDPEPRELPDPKFVPTSGSKDQRAKAPEGVEPPRQKTEGAGCPEGKATPGSIDQSKTTSGRINQGAQTPEVKSPRGRDAREHERGGTLWSIDRDGGFDPRPFLPEQDRNVEWREKGHGELRIPHRLFEFLHRATTTRNELLVLNCLVRFSLGFHRDWCEAGYSFISSWTGISDVANVRKSIKSLMALGLIRKTREHNCAANSGSIYEVPVVQAYLSYLKASKGGNGPSGAGPGEQGAETPGGISTLGLDAQRAEHVGASGQETLSPVVAPPTKKENKKQKIKKPLSSELPEELQRQIEQTRPFNKRRKEEANLNRLLETYTASDIVLALQFVKERGTLESGSACHSPFSYLGSAIEEVLREARRVTTSTAAASPVVSLPAYCHTTDSTAPWKEAVDAFQVELTESEQNLCIQSWITEQGNSSILPSTTILRRLAAMKWFSKKTIGMGGNTTWN